MGADEIPKEDEAMNEQVQKAKEETQTRQTKLDEPQGEQERIRNKEYDDGRRILAACSKGEDATELYSPERINKVCEAYGLVRGSSLDLRTGWDFGKEDHRRAAWSQIHGKTQPSSSAARHAQYSLNCRR